MRLQDRVAIVTGGSSGIGYATAARLLDEGARVAICGLNEDKARASAQKLGAAAGTEVLGFGCDVGDEAQVIRLVEATMGRFGRLDIVVNNAGMMVFKPLEELTDQDWRRVLDVDLLGAVHFTKQAFLRMKPGGAIVNVASVHAVMTSPLVAPYAAAKAAMLSLTRSAGIEGRDKGIRANVILPGAIDTPMLWDNPNIKSGAEKLDPKDVGRPQDVAAAVAFLASDDAAFITGTALRVDGGRLDRL